MTHFKILTVLLTLALVSTGDGRPFQAKELVFADEQLLVARGVAPASSGAAAGAPGISQASAAPSQQLVNAGLAGTVPVPLNGSNGSMTAPAGESGAGPLQNDPLDADLYGPLPSMNGTDPNSSAGPTSAASGAPPGNASASSMPLTGAGADLSAGLPSDVGLAGNSTMDPGSPAPMATHDASGQPYPSIDPATYTSAPATKTTPSVGNGSSLSGLESDFPVYSEFADNQTDAIVHPYLAETDTIFSTDSDREYGPTPYESRYRALDDTHGTFDVLKRWGGLAPYFSNPMYPTLQQQKSLPNHCSIQQVHMLHRSGARMPLDHPDEAVRLFRDWYVNATTGAVAPASNATFEGPLSFLNTWQYGLGLNELTRAGYQQMYDSGVHSFYRYGGLFNETTEPHKIVMRTTSAGRMFDSAEAWAVGFFGFKGAGKTASIEVEIEKPGMNSTLAPDKACPAAAMQHPGTDMANKWIDHYTERAVKRLQHFVQDATLSPEIVHAMQAMCPYETYAMGMSDFCALFTRNEWDSFEYAEDLRFQGDFGFMSPTGRAQGIGWAQEFVARLKGAKLDTNALTSQNATLLADTQAFPLDQRMYLDFGHDNLLVSVLAALNFTSFSTQLDPLHRDRTRNFIMSHISPFAARMFFEVLECDEAGGDAKEKYVRAILNDALLPMSASQGCVGHQSQHDGLCPLDRFIKNFETSSVPAADFAGTCFAASNATDAGNSTTASAANATSADPLAGMPLDPSDPTALGGPDPSSALAGGANATTPSAAGAGNASSLSDPTMAGYPDLGAYDQSMAGAAGPSNATSAGLPAGAMPGASPSDLMMAQGPLPQSAGAGPASAAAGAPSASTSAPATPASSASAAAPPPAAGPAASPQ